MGFGDRCSLKLEDSQCVRHKVRTDRLRRTNTTGKALTTVKLSGIGMAESDFVKIHGSDCLFGTLINRGSKHGEDNGNSDQIHIDETLFDMFEEKQNGSVIPPEDLS